MKKLAIFMLAAILLCGCTHEKKTSTFMLTRDNTLYALYNQDGKKLTEYQYKTFEEVKDSGYLVTNEKDQKGFISLKGEEIIAPGTYETLEAVDQMLYATKKVENKEPKKDDKKEEKKDNKTEEKKDDQKKEKKVATDGIIKTNLYVLNNDGEVLYSADEKTGIIKSGLPIIVKDGEYIVLSHNGEELYRGKETVQYASQYENSTSVVIGFVDHSQFYYFNEDKEKNIKISMKEKGHFKILAQDVNGCILNDETLKSMIYVDYKDKKYYQNTILVNEASFDQSGNIILKSNDKTFVYPIGKAPVLMTSYYLSSYTYVSRSNDIYGPHLVFKDGKNTGELSNCQLFPTAVHVYSDIFPVYQRNKGYEYYNFDNKKVINKTYLDAEPFDQNRRAIVKIDDKGYSLIDEKGELLTKEKYYQIKYIGSSYYAVYNETGLFGVLDLDGNEVFPMEYTSLPETPLVEYNEKTYLTLNKNGRSFVYDVKNDMKEVFAHEGNVVFNEKGYFSVDNQYFTFEGEEIK